MSVLTLHFERVIIYASEGCKFQVCVVQINRFCDTVRQLHAGSQWHFEVVNSSDFAVFIFHYRCLIRDFSSRFTVAVTWPGPASCFASVVREFGNKTTSAMGKVVPTETLNV
jgi:hypothetical protein